MLINSNNIVYVKNVTCKYTPHQLAYQNLRIGNTFYLDFPNNVKVSPTNAGKLSSDEIILLFQRERNNKLKSIGNWRLTHLVRRVDNQPVSNNPNEPYYRYSVKVEIVGIIPNGVDFTLTPLRNIISLSNCSRGGACSLKRCLINGTVISTVQASILQTFHNYGSVI